MLSLPDAPRPFLTPPVFRLAKPQSRATLTRPLRRPAAPLRPRLLYLDQTLPPSEPGECPPLPDDSSRPLRWCAVPMPSGPGVSPVSRLPVADHLPPAARSQGQLHAEREAIHELHRAARLVLAGIDSS